MTIEMTDTAERALALAFQSGDRAHGVQLIGRCARSWLKAGEVAHVLRWTTQLSRAEILDNDAIATSHIASMIFRRRFAEAKEWLRDAEQRLADSSAASARLQTLRLMLAVLSQEAGDDVLLAEVGDGPCDRYLSGTLIALQAYALLRKNRFDAAKRRALRAKELLGEHGDIYGASFAEVLVLFAQRLSGDLLASARTCERLYATLEQGPRNPAWVNAATALAQLRYEQNRLEEARSLCVELVPHLKFASTPESLATHYVTFARLELSAGHEQEALRLLEYLHSVMEDGRHSRLIALTVYERVRASLAIGEMDAAMRIANEAGIDADGEAWTHARAYDSGWERLGQTHALLLRYANAFDRARAVLQTLIKSAGHAGCIVRVIGLEATLADCEWQAGRRAQAFEAIERALLRSRAVGFTRAMFDEAPELGSILRAVSSERRIAQLLPANFLERYATLLPVDARPAAVAAPIEPLTERERRVLQLVASGMRNEEISAQLRIALSTTKWHLKNVFAKLGVACRTEALVRARQMNLLS